MNALTFWVAGEVVGQGSMRAVAIKGKPRVIHNSPRALMTWRTRIAQEAQHAMMADGFGIMARGVPVLVSATFYMARPLSHMGRSGLRPSAPDLPTGTPDIDKLARALLDGLTGVVFNDDAQVVFLHLAKGYCEIDEPVPGVRVTVEVATL
jgi:Holliday junction resolvase RusA-like endonuclease